MHLRSIPIPVQFIEDAEVCLHAATVKGTLSKPPEPVNGLLHNFGKLADFGNGSAAGDRLNVRSPQEPVEPVNVVFKIEIEVKK